MTKQGEILGRTAELQAEYEALALAQKRLLELMKQINARQIELLPAEERERLGTRLLEAHKGQTSNFAAETLMKDLKGWRPMRRQVGDVIYFAGDKYIPASSLPFRVRWLLARKVELRVDVAGGAFLLDELGVKYSPYVVESPSGILLESVPFSGRRRKRPPTSHSTTSNKRFPSQKRLTFPSCARHFFLRLDRQQREQDGLPLRARFSQSDYQRMRALRARGLSYADIRDAVTTGKDGGAPLRVAVATVWMACRTTPMATDRRWGRRG